MAKKRGNPLSGKFRDPPREGNAAIPSQADQDEEQIKLTGSSPPEQISQGVASTEPPEPPADPVPTDPPAPEQADQGDAPSQPPEAPADPEPAKTPGSEQTDQGDAPGQPPEPPADPKPTEAPDPEQADQDDTPSQPPDAPAQPAHPEARFVRLDVIQSLPGTFVKDTPREDYSELIDSIKAYGLEKPIILRDSGNGTYQLVDGFHRCEAMKRAGFSEIKAEVYDMSPLAASRYRREHRIDPNTPIPGKLLPAHPPKEEPPADKDTPAQDEEAFEVPENFTLPIAKEGQSELITTLKVADIHPFEGHPFNVLDNKDMWDLVESVKRYGVLEPVMVINRPEGGYEMVSGHRRMRACQLAGIQTIPTIVRNLDRDEAIIAMVDANLKREEISPMEKARAYQMKTDAMRRKVGRRSKEEIAKGEKPLSADEELARQVGESVATVQRFKTLNKLVPEMQELVDKKQVPVNTGADIAQLKPEEQKELADAIQKEAKVPTGAQVKEMKKQSAEGTLTTEAIKQAVAPTKREEAPPLKVTLVEEDLRPYFPDKRTTTPDVKKGIFEALALRQKLQERQAAAQNKAKPPDKPSPPGTQKKPEPAADGGKKPSAPAAGGRSKKSASPKAKKTSPTR